MGPEQMRRRDRRQRIAVAVREEGLCAREAAGRFGVSVTTVRRACVEFGVEVSGRVGGDRGVGMLGRLLGGATRREVAEEFGVSRQRVHQVVERARESGISLPEGV